MRLVDLSSKIRLVPVALLSNMQALKAFAVKNAPVVPLISGLCLAGFPMPVLAANQPAANQTAPSLSAVTRMYQAGDYRDALSMDNQLLLQNPASADLHYMKANLLVGLGQNMQAIGEYQQTLMLRPADPAITQYCLGALARLTAPTQGSAMIQAQASQLANGFQQTAASAANTMVADGNSFQKWNDRMTRRTVRDMQNSGTYLADGSWAPAYSAEDIQGVAAAGARRSQQAQNAAAQSAQDLATNAQIKIAQTVDSAQSLQDMLNAPAVKGAPHLQALGTNLFVRNYGDNGIAGSGQKALNQAGQFPVALKAAPESLFPKNDSQPGTAGRKQVVRATVSGAVVH